MKKLFLALLIFLSTSFVFADSVFIEGFEYGNHDYTVPVGWTCVKNAFIAKKPDGTYVNLMEGWESVPVTVAKDHNGNPVGQDAIAKDWKVVAGTANFEGVCSSEYDSGMYHLMYDDLNGGVNALFCGHDHTNDSIIYQEDPEKSPVYLASGLCSG